MKTKRYVVPWLAVAAAALALMASFVCIGMPTRAWAAGDYYAVLHEDGDLVFQAQPSEEEGVVTYSGSCDAYLSGKAPWLANAALIESVRFDESFASIQPKSLAFWFIGCKNLKSIDLQNLDASKSTSMRSMFSGCSSLTTIEHLSTFDTSSSTYFGSMFRDCSSLTSLDISHFDATHVGVLCFMFAGCKNLQTLNMVGEGWRTSSLYLMVHVWENCSSLKRLDLSYLDTSDVHSMAKDFNGCSSLEYLDLSGADTTNVGSLDAMFNGCDKLSTVKLGPKFSFNGMASAPQCALPAGTWKSAATGAVYESANVPNCTADTYTRVSAGGDDPTPEPSDASGSIPGEYDLPGLQSSLGMFNHFVADSQKLIVDEDRVTLSFTTDGSIGFISKVTKVAIGPSSKLINTDDMVEGETKYANSLVGNPVVFDGTLVSPEGSVAQYAYELEFAKAEFDRMIADDGGIYLTLFYSEKNAWHKGTSDLLLTLGQTDAFGSGGQTPSGPGSDTPEPTDPEESGEVVEPNAITDGTYAVELTALPSMIKLAGHGGEAAEPRVVVAGQDAWLVVSYRSSENSAWRYGQMAWGSYEDVVAAGKNGFGGAPTFKVGTSAADGMSDAALEAMTFALPLKKRELVEWLTSGEPKDFTVRYVSGYSGEHDGDWWKPKSGQSTLSLEKPRVTSKPVAVPADYAAVLDALAAVPTSLGSYTDASVAKLKKALASVNGSPKPASEQKNVDAMAKAIANAVKGLETKEAAAKRVAAEKTAAAKAAAAKAAAKREAAAKKVKNVTVNTKTVTAKKIAAALAAAKGKAKYVKTITLGKKVKKIAKGAFKHVKANTLVIKTKKLKKSSVKGSLKGSKVKTVKVKVGKSKANKQYAKKYKKLFTKKNAGKTPKVRAA